jgi:hypothetical protein
VNPDLLIELWNLSERIRSHGGVLPGESMVERYKYYVEHSESGKDCVYARKCRDLFLTHDYDDVVAQLKKVMELLV